MVGIIENWTFGGPLASSSDKFSNTIVYYTTHCPLGGGHGPLPTGSASCDMVDCE